MQPSLLTSWGLRDYGTATWEGGDSGCQHQGSLGDGGTAAVDERTAFRTGKQYTHQQVAGPVCGKCGARRVDNQIGLEATPELHIEALLEVFREVWRVLRKDGTLWLNYGDMMACKPNGRSAADTKAAGNDDRTFRDKPFSTAGGVIKEKDLVGMPWMLALALRADGWYLRSAITIVKNNPLPESVTDRPTNATEMLFLLTKQPKYYYDADAVREPLQAASLEREKYAGRNGPRGWQTQAVPINGGTPSECVRSNPAGRNKRNWWLINSQPMKDAHYAAFSEKLVEPCILAGTSERGVCPTCGAPWERVVDRKNCEMGVGGGNTKYDAGRPDGMKLRGGGFGNGSIQTTGWRPTCAHPHTEEELLPAVVLDPFAGSGTVSRVASRLGRRSIGIELSEEYVNKIARKRTSQGGLGL